MAKQTIITDRPRMMGKTTEAKNRVEPGKMHLYVDGKHKISVDEAVAHEVAATYAREGDDVWLTRAPVSMTEAKGGRMRGYGKR